MRHSATVGPRRFTDVDRELNVFRFCNSDLIFMGVGYQPGGPEGSHFVWPLPFDLFGMGDPTRSTRLQPT